MTVEDFRPDIISEGRYYAEEDFGTVFVYI